MTQRRQTMDEWLDDLAAEGNMTVAQVLAERAPHQHPVPCGCDWDRCTGWAWSDRPDTYPMH